MSVKVVANEDEAIAHINRYGTMHSEAIVAEDADACERFLDAVDASAVYANASTRFTDGGEFGWVPRSASRPKSSTPAAPSPPRPSPPTNTSSAAPARFAPKPTKKGQVYFGRFYLRFCRATRLPGFFLRIPFLPFGLSYGDIR